MKRFLVLAIGLLSFAAVHAQTNSKVVVRTSNYRLFDYGYQATVTTTDATATTISTVAIGADEAGIVEVQVVGFNPTTGDAVTGSKIVRYKKTGGTLTLSSSDSIILAVEADSGLSTSTYSVSAVSSNIAVKVTGKASTTVVWKAYIRKISLTP